MASNPPGKCCFTGVAHAGVAKGKHSKIFGLDTYITGVHSNDKIIIIMTDSFGNKFNNVLLIADAFGEAGYKVLIPDILDNDLIDMSNDRKMEVWITKHDSKFTRKFSEPFSKSVRSELKPKFLGVVGYCLGAKYALQLINAKEGIADVAAIAHPSFVDIKEVEAIGKNPLLISAAEIDAMFSTEKKYETEAKLQEIGARYQLDVFSGVSHGYAVRHGTSCPLIKYAKEKTFHDQVYWFNHFSAAIFSA
ncbi:LAMI_0A00166g1_1 [Lachancea mirantina]|uniref:LAMI_0A00166g1_1 n=1 Tax=Lachancea mirantina TaxID=1230905 RepID=A0A1G4IL07_9SACH|nr:LAMI_0A00166g1_1 [Lachancea mirantina]